MPKDIFGKTALKVCIHSPDSQGDSMGNEWYIWSPRFAHMTLSSDPFSLCGNKLMSFNSLLPGYELFPREIFNPSCKQGSKGPPQWASGQGQACLNTRMSKANISNIQGRIWQCLAVSWSCKGDNLGREKRKREVPPAQKKESQIFNRDSIFWESKVILYIFLQKITAYKSENMFLLHSE